MKACSSFGRDGLVEKEEILLRSSKPAELAGKIAAYEKGLYEEEGEEEEDDEDEDEDEDMNDDDEDEDRRPQQRRPTKR